MQSRSRPDHFVALPCGRRAYEHLSIIIVNPILRLRDGEPAEIRMDGRVSHCRTTI